MIRQSEYFLQIPNLVLECLDLDGSNANAPIIIEENYTSLAESIHPLLNSKSYEESYQDKISSSNLKQLDENNILITKSSDSNLILSQDSNNKKTLSIDSPLIYDLNKNGTNNFKGTKSSEFFKKSKSLNKDIIASETNSIKLLSYKKMNNEETDVNLNASFEDKKNEKNKLIKNELTSSLPIKIIREKNTIYKKLSVDDYYDMNKKNQYSIETNNNIGSEHVTNKIKTELFNINEIKNDFICSLPNMEYNERPIDVENIQTNINNFDANRNSLDYEENGDKNSKNNLINSPLDCSFKSRVLYESFRGRTNTLDRRRMNLISNQKNNIYVDKNKKNDAENDQINVKENFTSVNSIIIKKDVHIESNTLCPLITSNILK